MLLYLLIVSSLVACAAGDGSSVAVSSAHDLTKALQSNATAILVSANISVSDAPIVLDRNIVFQADSINRPLLDFGDAQNTWNLAPGR